RLAVADHAGLAVSLGMQGRDLLEKNRLRPCDVLDRLTGNRIGQETDEIAGVTGLECDADFAVGLEAADAGTVPRARVDDDEGPARRIEFDAGRRDDAHESIVHRALERPAVDD